MTTNPKIAAADCASCKLAYTQMHNALDELQKVVYRDDVITHMIRVLTVLNNQLWPYATKERKEI